MRLPLALLASAALVPLLAGADPAPSSDEVAARFKAMDGDGDGYVTVGEQLAHLLAKHAAGRELTDEQNAAALQIAKAMIADQDADKDGRVSLAELRTPGGDRLTAMFKSADTDHDGYATRDEMRASIRRAMLGDAAPDAGQTEAIENKAAESLTLFDFDGDGRVSFVELRRFMEIEASAPKAPTLDARAVDACLETKPDFAAVDTDANGLLTGAELSAWGRLRLRHAGPQHRDAFRQKTLVLLGYDTDGDGRITRAEWTAGANARTPESDARRIDRLVESFAALTFADLDADADGIVAEKEIADATAKLAKGAPAKDALTLRMIAAMNLAKRKGDDGKITRDSWAAATARAERERLKERIAERFSVMDKNGDGAVVADEFAAFLGAQQDAQPDAEALKEIHANAVRYVAETDRNGDRRIDLNEYTEAVLKAQAEQEREEQKAAAAGEARRKEFADKHRAMDANADGRVTLPEMTAFVTRRATETNDGKPLTEAQLAEAAKGCGDFLKQIDTDGDRTVSLQEYLAAMAKAD